MKMSETVRLTILTSAAFMSLAWSAGAQAQQANMSFFVTSTGAGKGADLGGLAGADARCQQLAQAAGAGAKTWHAYLSTQAASGQPAVNARERIGNGPWQNAKGVVIAKNVDELHSLTNNLTKQTALTEKGDVVKGAATRQMSTTPSPVRPWKAAPSRPARTAHARTGRAAPRAPPCSATSTGRAFRTLSRAGRGMPRTRPADLKAVAARRTSRAPAAPACSIVLPRIRVIELTGKFV